MAEITREEFKKIYDEKFVPILENLELGRLENIKKCKKLIPIAIVGLLIALPFFFTENPVHIIIGLVIFVVSQLITISLYMGIKNAERKDLKNQIVSKILALYGNLFFSDNKDAVSFREIKDMGLYRRASKKTTDDVIIGVHKGCNLVISESRLTHQESRGSGENRSTETVVDFNGLIVKIQMKKNFTGKTIVGIKGDIDKKWGFEKVELESIDFMKNREVYSTDQIEARYILTTAFMERLAALGKNFVKDYANNSAEAVGMNPDQVNQAIGQLQNIKAPAFIQGAIGNLLEREVFGVSAGFVEGYAYLFIPSYENFFEVDTSKTLLDPTQYYIIYKQLDSILSVIDHLNLDSKTGL